MINTSNPGENLCGLKKADFQKVIDGKQTDLFILKNESGAEVAITNYGGAVVAIMVPDKNGNYANVIQGHDTIDKVINSPEPFLSTLIGRYGNRIAKGKFLLDGKEYQLAVNNGPNHLHGGPTGYHARVWEAEQTDSQTLKLHYLSADGEEGFPGNLDLNVTYSFTNDNELKIDYSATTDKKTLVNLTHHAFFSLSGLATPTASVENNIVTINADWYTPVDETCIPLGEIAPVEGTPMDFRVKKAMGRDIHGDYEALVLGGGGYDHNWCLNNNGIFAKVAEMSSDLSGITMEVYTDLPGVHIYSGNYLREELGKQGIVYKRYQAMCFETQYYPDAINQENFQSPIVKKSEEYRTRTVYKFV